MTSSTMAKLIGRNGLLREGELGIRVEIRDVREVWGRTDYLVVPEAGTGSTWVSAERVHLDEEG